MGRTWWAPDQYNIDLGRRAGIPTPVNERALAELETAAERCLGPEPYSPQEFRLRFEDVVDWARLPEPPENPESGSLEI